MNPFEQLSMYELRNLPTHLAAAGRLRDLCQVLTLEWVEPEERPLRRQGLRAWVTRKRDPGMVVVKHYRNGWYSLKEALGQADDYANDLALALQSASNAAALESADAGTAPSLGLVVRYALMTASMGELAGRVPAKLVRALCERGVWSARQAISYTRRIPEADERWSVLVSLIPVLEGSTREQVINEAISTLREIRETGQWLELKKLVPHVGKAHAQQIAATFKDGDHAGAVLACVSGRLAFLGSINEALDLAAEIPHERDQADAIIAVAPLLDPDEWRRAVSIAEHIDEEGWRLEAKAALYARATAFDDPEAVLALISGLPEPIRVQALIAASATVNEAVRGRALHQVRRLQNPKDRAKVVAAYIATADQPQRSSLFKEFITDLARVPKLWRQDLLVAAAPVLTSAEANKALMLASRSTNAILALASRLPEPRRTDVARREIARAKRSRRALPLLIPAGWAAFQPAEALAAASAVGDRRSAINDIAPDLPEDLLRKALATLLQVANEELEVETVGGREPGRAIAVLVGELAGFDPHDALGRIRSTADEEFCGEAIASAAARIADSCVLELLNLAVALVSQKARVTAISALADRIPRERQRFALDSCKGSMELLWSQAARRFAPHLGDAMLAYALEEAAHLKDDGWRGGAIASLCPYLPPGLLGKALHLAEAMSSEHQVATLRAIACRLAACGRAADALDVAESTSARITGQASQRPGDWLDGTLAALSPQLTGAELQRALATAEASNLVKAQAALIRVLDDTIRPNLARKLWDDTLNKQGDSSSVDVLTLLAPWLSESELLAAIDRTPSPELVEGLAPYLQESSIMSLATVARKFTNSGRLRALVALARGASSENRCGLASEALHISLERNMLDAHNLSWADDVSEFLQTMTPQNAQSILMSEFPHLASGPRLRLVTAVRGLAAQFARCGGHTAVLDAISALEDSMRWWL